MTPNEPPLRTASGKTVVRTKSALAERGVLERSLPWLWLALSIGWAIAMYRSAGPDWARSLLELL